MIALEPFISLGLDLSHYHPYENVEVIVGQTTGDFLKTLENSKIPFELFRPKDPSKTGIFALFVDKDRADAVRSILGEVSYSIVPVFEGEGDPRGMRVSLKEGLAKVNSSLEEVELNIKEIIDVYGDNLVAAEEHLSIEVEKAESPLRCGGTPNALFIEGWIPSGEKGTLEKALTDAIGDGYHIEILDLFGEATQGAEVAADGGDPDEVKTEEKVDPIRETPVMLKNPPGFKIYEFLVDMVSRPRYDEVDPSLFMYITFPIFFGMMLGDIAYGLAFIILGYWLLRPGSWEGVRMFEGETRRRMTRMIMNAGWATVIWGFIYGEFAGFEIYGIHGLIWPHALYVPSLDLFLPINRLESAMLMIKLCIYVGMAHVTLGLLIGFVNFYKKHGLKHAVLGKASWILILLGGFIVFKLFFADEPISITEMPGGLGVFLLIGGIIMLLMGEGMHGVMELPGIISNVLSYTRLYAIGLSSLGIAMTFNGLAEMLWITGPVGMIAAVLVFASGHLLNLLLGLLAPSLHSLRLHYVEWMNKFFTGGGVPYKPFGRERVYTEV